MSPQKYNNESASILKDKNDEIEEKEEIKDETVDGNDAIDAMSALCSIMKISTIKKIVGKNVDGEYVKAIAEFATFVNLVKIAEDKIKNLPDTVDNMSKDGLTQGLSGANNIIKNFKEQSQNINDLFKNIKKLMKDKKELETEIGRTSKNAVLRSKNTFLRGVEKIISRIPGLKKNVNTEKTESLKDFKSKLQRIDQNLKDNKGELKKIIENNKNTLINLSKDLNATKLDIEKVIRNASTYAAKSLEIGPQLDKFMAKKSATAWKAVKSAARSMKKELKISKLTQKRAKNFTKTAGIILASPVIAAIAAAAVRVTIPVVVAAAGVVVATSPFWGPAAVVHLVNQKEIKVLKEQIRTLE